MSEQSKNRNKHAGRFSTGKLKKGFDVYLKGLFEMVFPHICVICNSHLDRTDYCLCPFCCNRYFERAAPDSSLSTSEEIYPEYIKFHASLWEFEKGSVIQDLMHFLKYENMYGIGLDFGKQLGKCLESVYDNELPASEQDPVLIPVPLHKQRQKKRGYNQARAIAEGISRYTGWRLAGDGSVVRVKKTGAQSGLTIQERRKNMKSAFRIVHLDRGHQYFPIIVDDIFTTGTTTFELAGLLVRSGFTNAGIATVARTR